MAKAFPDEFRRDVVKVARKREATLSQVAKDFGIGQATLHSWLKRYEADDDKVGMPLSEAAQLRDSKKRVRLLEQENEILRRAAVYLGRGINPK